MASRVTLEEVGQRLRVLMLSHYFAERRGGVELVAAALARGLSSPHMFVTWLATGTPDETADRIDYQAETLRASGAAERVLQIPYPLLLPASWHAIFRAAKQNDVILAHDALQMSSVIACCAAMAYRKPFIVVQHIHDVPYVNPFVRALMTLANRCVAARVLRKAWRVIFVSERTMRSFTSTIRWQRSPLVIFNGVATDVYTPAVDAAEVSQSRVALGLPIAGTVALFVGRFVEKKGLRVLQAVAHDRPDVLFAFAGRGPLDPAAWNLPNVRVYSDLSRDALAQLYRASDGLLLPSVGEGFPLVVQEALACGLPVICGIDSAQADPEAAPYLCGVEVEPDHPVRTALRFGEQLDRVLVASADMRRRRADFARSRYSWPATCNSYARVIREAADRSAAQIA
jgi:glycosyltransferase involved in cell wall biosynthesis